jgi:hypothetical protein
VTGFVINSAEHLIQWFETECVKLNGCISEAECCFDTAVRQLKAHTLKCSAVWKTDSTPLEEVESLRDKSVSNLLFRSIKCSWFWSVTCSAALPHTRNHMWVLMLNPPTRNMVVKPCGNRKWKTCWCLILHEVQFLILVTLRNNGQHEIIKHSV